MPELLSFPSRTIPAAIVLCSALVGMADDRGASPQRWRVEGSDALFRVVSRDTWVERGARASAAEVEQWDLQVGAGTYIHFACSVPTVPVIEELFLEVSVYGDRPGIQMFVRAVLPRSLDPRTGMPRQIVLRGPETKDPGRWEQLRLDHLPDLLEEQIRILRSSMGQPIDGREAFVDGVLLNVHNGTGNTRVRMEPPTVGGYVPAGAAARPAPPLQASGTSAPATITVRGGVMEVDGRAFFVRAVESHGEGWDFLRSLGFNTVKLERPVNVDDLLMARQANLWLIAPLPGAEQFASIQDHCDRILAWDVQGVDPDTLQGLRRSGLSRPVIARCGGHDDEPAADEIRLRQASAWDFHHHAPEPSHGVHWWTIPTAPAQGVDRQLRAFGCDPSQFVPERDQLAVQSCLAVASGARGLVFRGGGRLDGPSPAARLRAMTLKQLNAMLLMFDPWFADGALKESLQCNVDDMIGIELSKPAGRLAMLIRRPLSDQCVCGPVSEEPASIFWHGIIETNGLFVVRSTSMMPLSKRPAIEGGTMHLPEVDRVNFVVATASDYAAQQVLRRWYRGQRSRLQDELDWLDLFVKKTREDLARLSVCLPDTDAEQAGADQAQAEAIRARHCWESQEWPQCRQHLRAAERQLLTVRKQCWERLVGSTPTSVCGLAVQFDFLDDYVRLCRFAKPEVPGLNLLPTGDCEQEQQMRSAGWQIVSPVPTTDARPTAVAGITSACVHGGRGSLRISLAPRGQSDEQTPQLSVVTPPLATAAGRLVQIAGWLRVEAPGSGPAPPLCVYDSSGGWELAHHCPTADTWQPFQLVRMTDDGEPLRIRFVLSGPGTAFIDDVTVTPLLAEEVDGR